MSDYQTYLDKLNQNLNVLREREAKYAGQAPLALLNQIEDHRTAIELTRQALAGELSAAEWQAGLQPLLVAVDPLQAAQQIGLILGQQPAGPAGEIAAQLRLTTLDQLRRDPRPRLVVEEYQADPAAAERLLVKKLAAAIESNLDFAEQLRTLLARLAQQIPPEAGSTSYTATMNGSGSLAQGPGATAVTASGPGATAIGSLGGDVTIKNSGGC